MTGMYGQIVFIVWRESLEALLVIGILNAWLNHRDGGRDLTGRKFLWYGVAVGLLSAALLAVVLLFFEGLLEGDRQDYFQILMALVAASLIVQMVAWMRKNGKTLKHTLEQGAEQAATKGNWWGVAILAASSVAREGSETAVFLYGVIAAADQSTYWLNAAAITSGIAAAAATYGALFVSAWRFPWPLFFRLTEITLLFFAASLFMTCLDRLIGLDIVHPLTAPLWDTSWILNDSQGLGGLVGSLTGYRARPELLPLLTYAAYWLLVVIMLQPIQFAKLKAPWSSWKRGGPR
jgi:high-affinity iron transporter